MGDTKRLAQAGGCKNSNLTPSGAKHTARCARHCCPLTASSGVCSAASYPLTGNADGAGYWLRHLSPALLFSVRKSNCLLMQPVKAHLQRGSVLKHLPPPPGSPFAFTASLLFIALLLLLSLLLLLLLALALTLALALLALLLFIVLLLTALLFLFFTALLLSL